MEIEGVYWVALPTLALGGASILYLLATEQTWYRTQSPIQEPAWASGHGQAGVLLALALLGLLIVNASGFSATTEAIWQWAILAGMILIPASRLLSAVNTFTQESAGANMAYAGALALGMSLLAWGIGVLSSG